MIVELVGLPGAGKSTITEEFIKSQKNYIYFQEMSKELVALRSIKIRFFFFIASHTFLFSVLFLKTFSYRNFNRYKKLIVMLFLLKEVACQKKFIIMDQGILQMLTSLYVNKKFDIKKIFKKICFKMGFSDYVLIKIIVPIEISKKRIDGRDKIGCEFKGLTGPEFCMKIDGIKEALDKVEMDKVIDSSLLLSESTNAIREYLKFNSK